MANPQYGILEKIYTTFLNNPGKMLIQTSVAGWALSSLAQIAAIVMNEKIPKEQKMFMIPQEFADGIVNILSFLLVTKTFTAVANRLVSQGKWLPINIAEILKKSNLYSQTGKAGFDVLKKANLQGEAAESFHKWSAGVDVSAALAGSVISCNIITPLVRNLYASKRQQGSIARMNNRNERKNNEFVNTYFRPTMATFRGQASIYPTAYLKV